eukprot:Gb_39546 [translate_table: standard]
MKNHLQRWHSQARNGQNCKRTLQEVILIGFLPQGGGLELISWTINTAARPGDVLIALIVCDPSSTVLPAGKTEEEQADGVERFVVRNKRKDVKSQLGELRHLCKAKQIQMHIKFAGGENPEEVLIEQAKSLNASTLVIGTSDRFVSWRKRSRSSYCIRNAPAGCSVVIVKNGKIVHYKENQFKVPKEADSESSSSSCEGMHLLHLKQETQDGCCEDFQVVSSSSSNVFTVNFEGKYEEEEGCKNWSEQTHGSSPRGEIKQETEDQFCGDSQIQSSPSSSIFEVFFDVNEEEEGIENWSEQTQGSSPRGVQKQETEDQFHGDLQLKASSSSDVFEVYFDVNDDEEGGGHKSCSDQIGGNSPRGVLEGSASCLDSDSSSSPSSHSFSEKAIISSPSHLGDQNGEKGFGWRGFLRLWKQRSVRRLSTFPHRSASRLAWENHVESSSSRIDSFSQTKEHSSICSQIFSLEKSLTESALKPSWKCFTFKELETATDNFSSDNLIGKGGYAEVYKGSLPDGQIVAIKRLNRGKTEEQRVRDFLTELGIIVHINHPNAARLIGFGVEGGLHIILQFSPHGSLASMLHGTNSRLLNWDIRYRVALGTAQGLLYLHEGCQRRIIHRDIKASNILLTEDFEPQISDFGLAKWLPKQWTHHTVTPIEGTFGYLAPEYFMHGIVDEKTDVFAFGVLLLELVTGRHPIDSSQQSLVMWAKPLIETRNLRELVDPYLGDAYNVQQMNFMVLTAGFCVQQSAILRPCMAHVLQLLTGDREHLESKEPWRTPLLQLPYLEESSDTEEYTSTRYQNDLTRHREVALEF